MEKYFSIPVADFKEAIAKEFEVSAEQVIIEPYDGALGDVYGFDIKHKVLTEHVVVVDDRVLNALNLAQDDHVEYFEFGINKKTGEADSSIGIHVTKTMSKPIYKDLA